MELPKQKDILSKIIETMKYRPQSPQYSSPEREKYEKEKEEINLSYKNFENKPTITLTQKEHLKDLLNSSKNAEIEISFGTFKTLKDKREIFIPGLLSFSQFNSLKTYLNGLVNSSNTFQAQNINDTVEIMNIEVKQNDRSYFNQLRKITFETENIFQEKIRFSKQSISNEEWGYKISKSTEREIDFDNSKFKPEIKRSRQRYTYREVSESEPLYGVHFDLSIIKEERLNASKEGKKEKKVMIKYEVEIERDALGLNTMKTINVFEDALNIVLLHSQHADDEKQLMSLRERKHATSLHNSFFLSEIKTEGIDFYNPYKIYGNYWNKPEDISLDDLTSPFLNNFAVTIKLDGVRRFIFITKYSIYAYNPPDDVWKVGLGNPKFEGTLLDCELYEDTLLDIKKYYVFDILFYKGEDVRQYSFNERYELIKKINFELFGADVHIKEFFVNGTFYEKTRLAFENVPDLRVDGLIFQPSHRYKNNHTRKWKPENLLTIDFLLKPIEEEKDTFFLVVGGKNEDILFEGTVIHPFNGKITIENSEFMGYNVSNRIIECSWNYEDKIFTPQRIREDRNRPNNIKTARNVWEDIMNPISRHTIEGDTLLVMRKYHNIEKKKLLESNFSKGDIIIDIGSGRGGDIGKWKKLGLSKVFVIEPNEENLQELLKRKETFVVNPGEKMPDIEVIVDKDGNQVGAEDTETIKEYIKKTKINGIVAFFSLTFFTENMDKYNSLINTISSILPPGGRFIGIVMDGERTRDYIPKLEEASSTGEYVPFEITAQTELNDDTTGNEIKIEIKDESSMVSNQTEWLFYFEKFKKALNKKGIDFVKDYFLDIGPIFNVLPRFSKEFSSLNRVFIFENPQSHKKIKEEERIPILPPIDHVEELVTNVYHEKGLVYTGVSYDESNFIHCVIKSFDDKYDTLDLEERKEYIAKIRKKLGSKLTLSDFKSLDKGRISEVLTNKTLKSMKIKDKDKALDIAYLQFKLNLMDMTVYIGERSTLEYLSNLLGINVFVLGGNFIPTKFGCKSYIAKRKCAVLYTPDTIHYTLVGQKSIKNEEENIITLFKYSNKFIQEILGLCKL